MTKYLLNGEESERPRGLFTKTDRAYLEGELEYDRPQDEYNIRRRIRERLYHMLLDGYYLENIDEEDRSRVFDPCQEPRTPPKDQVEAFEEMDRSRSDALTDAETINVENALVRWFALFYESIDEQSSKSNSSSFVQIERDSIHRVAEDNGWTVRKCEIAIDIDKDTSTDQLLGRFEAGADLSDNELGRLFREEKIDGDDLAEAMAQEHKTEQLQEN